MKRIIVGATGSSGIILTIKTVEALVHLDYKVDLVLSQHALYVASLELEKKISSPRNFLAIFDQKIQNNITLHGINNVGASICSGTHLSMGMIIQPCSMATVAAIAMGLSDNSLRRAADVSLKERRALVIAFREAPLSTLHLRHLLSLSEMGAVILPPAPAWYLKPKNKDDIEDFLVGRGLDALKIPHALYQPWKATEVGEGHESFSCH